MVLDGLVERNKNNLVVNHTAHYAALVIEQCIDSSNTKTASKIPVVCRWRTTTLNVTENDYSHIEFLSVLSHSVPDVVCATCIVTLSNKNDARGFLFGHVFYKLVVYFIEISNCFRNKYILCSTSNTAAQSNKTSITAHYLNEEHSFVAGCRITNLVDCFDNGIQCCVVSDCHVGTIKVVVDCARKTNYWEWEIFGEFPCAPKCTITADNYKSINIVLLEVVVCYLLTFAGSEPFATSSLEDCTTTLNYIANAFRFHRDEIICD